MKRIEIPLSNGYRLVAEANPDTSYKEIFIGLLDEKGLWHQDLAIVGQAYMFDRDYNVLPKDQLSVKVYADSNNEDFTEEFIIERFEEGETNDD